jgi:tetratricopeptide (TPR) repeat protein
MGDNQSAILHFEKALSIDPNFGWAKGGLLNIHLDAAYSNGNYEKWFEIWYNKVEGIWNEEGREAVLNVFREKGHIAGIEEMFKMNEKYGVDCFMTESLKSQRYIYLKNYDKAIEHLEKAYEMHAISAAYMGIRFTNYDQLKGDPRYIELLKKMKLPLE